MSSPISNSVQGHLTLALPMRSPADGQALRDKVPGVMPAFSKAADAVGTLHYYRLIALDATRFLFLAEYDGELEAILRAMATELGPVMDDIFSHIEAPPPMPVAHHPDAFVDWAVEHQISPFMVYENYPSVSVQEIKSRAVAAGITTDEGGVEQRPLLVVMPMKSRLAIAAVRMAFYVLQRYLQEGGDEVGTVHFAHLVQLPNNQIGFFTIYDGPFEKYAQDFAEKLGPAFDLLFKFTIDPPPTPTAKNAAAFTKWVEAHDLPPIGFYSAYPGQQVQDVRELLAY
jgi:hypothetical protein